MIKANSLVAMLFVLLLSGMFAAQGNPFDTGNTGGEFTQKFEAPNGTNPGGDFYRLGVSAIMLCVFFNVLVYMAGFAFESQHLKNYAKAEFLQVTASGLMIFFVVALLYEVGGGGAFQVMGDILGGTGSSVACNAATGGRYLLWSNTQFGGGPIGAFKCKIQDKINALDKQYANLYNANMAAEGWASVCYSLFGVPVWCNDWYWPRHANIEQTHLLTNKIVTLLMPLHGQFILADYVQKNMLSIFLPLGLVLRILPPTRGVGGLFIAIAIGFYFVWPTFSVLTDPTFIRSDQNTVNNLIQGVCFSGFKGTTVLTNTAFPPGQPDGNELANASAADLLYQMTVGTFFYPFVAFVITLIFVRAATPILGGDLGELMKMVSRIG